MPGSLADDTSFHTVRVSLDPSPAYYEMKTQLAYDGVVKLYRASLPKDVVLDRLEIVAVSGGPWLVDDVLVYVPARDWPGQEAVSYSQAMVHKCKRDGYLLELPYWQEKLKADTKIFEASRLDALRAMLTPNGIALPADLAARAEEIAAAGQAAANPKPTAATEAAWKQTLDALTAVDQPYGWHTVKTHLLRDLANRCRRVSFYAGAIRRPPPRGRRTRFPRTFRTGPGGRRGQPELGKRLRGLLFRVAAAEEHRAPEAETTASRSAKRLASATGRSGTQRTGLEKDVLAFLQTLDTTGKFRDLGVPFPAADLRGGWQSERFVVLVDSRG